MKQFIIDIVFVAILAICSVIVFAFCAPAWAEQTPVVTTATTTAETTEYITEPAVTEEPATEATEPPVKLFDVPLEEDLQLHIIEEAEAHGIDPAIIVAMAWRESTYTPGAIGDGGDSYGLLQIQPKWHYDRMRDLGCTDLLDPYQNVTVGVDILAGQLARYSGDMAKALVAYNAGHYKGTVTSYAKTILAMAEELGVSA